MPRLIASPRLCDSHVRGIDHVTALAVPMRRGDFTWRGHVIRSPSVQKQIHVVVPCVAGSLNYKNITTWQYNYRERINSRILAWPDDPTHPLSIAEELDGLLSNSRLDIARDNAEVRQWPEKVREFIRSL